MVIRSKVRHLFVHNKLKYGIVIYIHDDVPESGRTSYPPPFIFVHYVNLIR